MDSCITHRFVYKTTIVNPDGLLRIYIGKRESKYDNPENDPYCGSGNYISKVKKNPKYHISREILEFADSLESLNTCEKKWISTYRTKAVKNPEIVVVNLADGGDGVGSDFMRKQWTDPAYRKMLSDSSKRLWNNIEYRKTVISKISLRIKETWEKPEYRKTTSQSISIRQRQKEPWLSIIEVQKLWIKLGKPSSGKYKSFRKTAVSVGLPDVKYQHILKALEHNNFIGTKLAP